MRVWRYSLSQAVAWTLILCLVLVSSATGYAQRSPEMLWQRGSHVANVLDVEYSLDGRFMVTSGAAGDRTAKIWRRTDGQLLHTLGGHTGIVSCATFSPDSRYVVTCSNQGLEKLMRLWTVDGGKPVHTWTTTNGFARARFSPDGRFLAATSYGSPHRVYVYRTDTFDAAATLDLTDEYSALAFSADGSELLAGPLRDDRSIKVWRTSDWSLVRQIPGSAHYIDYSPSGERFAVTNYAGDIKIFSPQGSLLNEVFGAAAYDVDFSPDGNALAAVVGKGVKVFRVADASVIGNFPLAERSSYGVDYSPEGNHFAIAAAASVVIADAAGIFVQQLVTNEWPVRNVAVLQESSVVSTDFGRHADGSFRASTVEITDLATGSLIRSWDAHTNPFNPGAAEIQSMAISPNGQYIATGGVEGNIKVWRPTGELVHTFAIGESSIYKVAFSPDSSLLAAAISARAQVWRLSDFQQSYRIDQQSGQVRACAFSRDGTMLAIASNAIYLHNAQTGELIRSFSGGQTSGIVTMEFSSTGEFFVCGHDVGLVTIWRTDNLGLIGAFQAHPFYSRISTVKLIAADKVIVTASTLEPGRPENSTDRSIGFFKVSDGSRIGTIDGETGSGVEALAFSGDERSMIFGRLDGTHVTAKNPFDFLNFSVHGVKPQSAARLMPVHVRAFGGGFEPGDQVILRRSGQDDIEPIEPTQYVDELQLNARFDLRGATAGKYDVIVKKVGGAEARLSQGFEVINGVGSGAFEARLTGFTRVRPDRDYTVYLEYENNGSGWLDAPLLVVEAPWDLRLPTREKSRALQILAVGEAPDAGRLAPGAHYRIPITYRSPSDGGGTITVSEVTDIQSQAYANNWESVFAQVYIPGYVPVSYWERVWLNFISLYGNTAQSHLAGLRATATYLANAGERTYSVSSLMENAMAQATGDIAPMSALDSMVDAREIVSGPGLELVRFMPTGLAGSRMAGPFGKGWWHNFEYRLLQNADSLTIEGPGGRERKFSLIGEKWKGGQGDHGVMELVNGDYRLVETDGTTMIFGSDGKLMSLADTNANSLTLSYLGNKLQSVSHSPSGKSLTIVYSGDLITAVSDSSGRTTTYGYDINGKVLLNAWLPGPRHFEYDYYLEDGSLTSLALKKTVFPDGTLRKFYYDGAGRIARISPLESENDLAASVRFQYPGQGTIEILDAGGRKSTIQTSPKGLPLIATDPLGNSSSAQYDADLNPERQMSPRGFTWSGGFDTKGNQLQSSDPLGGMLKLGFTAGLNRLDWLRDRRGKLMDFEFDVRGNATKITYADGTFERFQYDGEGNVAAWWNRRERNNIVPTAAYAYNERGQLTGIAQSDGRTYSYGYDARGNMTSANDSLTGLISMTYDPSTDDLRRIEYPGGHWFEYDYYPDGKRKERRDNFGYKIKYFFDSLGRLESLRDETNALIIRYEYDMVGRLSKEYKANDTRTEYTYDDASRVQEIRHYGPGNVLQDNFAYQYDADGNPTRVTGTRGTYSYGYDSSGQLTSAHYPNGQYELFEYDAEGNRLQVNDTGTVIPYSVNHLNQYTQVGSDTYEYDDDGNLIKKYSAGNLMEEYSYDGLSRLVAVSRANETWHFKYDAFGKRSSTVQGGTETRYVNDGCWLAAEVGSEGIEARYLQGLGLVAQQRLGSVAFYAFDITGNTRQLTNHSGSVVNSNDYRAFGADLYTSELAVNRFRYVGRTGLLTSPSGLLDTRTRSIDAQLGRFLSSDRLGLAGESSNLYSYVGNSPIAFVDPEGDIAVIAAPLIGVYKALEEAATIAWFIYDVHEAYQVGRAFGLQSGLGALRTASTNFLVDFTVGRAVGSLASGLANRAMGPALKGMKEVQAKVNREIGKIGDPAARRLWYDWASRTSAEMRRGIASQRAVIEFLLEQMMGEMRKHFEFDELGRLLLEIARSSDPNEKRGPEGVTVGGKRYLGALDPIEFTILFENKPVNEAGNRIAHAQKVQVVDYLVPGLDWTSMELGSITFGNQTVTELGGYQWGSIRVPLAPPVNPGQEFPPQENPDNSHLVVDVSVSYDPATGKIVWTLQAIDPLTNEPPLGEFEGILPANGYWVGSTFNSYGDARGEGKLVFKVRPRAASEGAYLENKADIIFDTNPVIPTNPFWSAYFDLNPPTSNVAWLPPTGPNSFPVKWIGNDGDGSGVATYTVFVSINGGPYTPWMADTTETTAMYNGSAGNSYRFYSVAKDNLGRVEAAPVVPDAETYTGNNVAVPYLVTVTQGSRQSGAVSDLHFSDEKRYVAIGDGSKKCTVQMEGVFEGFVTASELSFTWESSSDQAKMERLEFYNFVAQKWEEIGASPSTRVDSTKTRTATVDAVKYMSSNGIVRARVICERTLDTATGLAPSIPTLRVDLARWTLTP
ncbi:MAG: hypothetical protein HONBIEJF_00323 [Fimbriimonadaceae bacterium]|nr:hypothetical protein [Fimbriimonadaceae bacterium]